MRIFRSLTSAAMCSMLAVAQQPQPQTPVAPGQAPQPTTRQGVEAPPPPLAQPPAPGTAPNAEQTRTVPGPRTPYTPPPVNPALQPAAL